MKKTLIISIFMVLGTFSTSLFASRFNFGIEGAAGINTVQIRNSTENIESDFDFLPSYRFGVSGQFNFNDVTSLRAKVLAHNENGFSVTDSTGKIKASFSTIDLPVLLKLNFLGIETVPGIFSLFAGPNFSFRITDIKTSQAGFVTDLNTFETDDFFAVGLESGAEYSFNKENGFAVGFSVLFDISTFSNDKDFKMQRISVMPYMNYRF